jgi:hypothetical protein
MNFKSFVYYCALCGAWAAFFTWALITFTKIYDIENKDIQAALVAGFLGVLVGGVVGLLDALLNSVGAARFVRVFICMGVGFLGGLVGGYIGQKLYMDGSGLPKFVGWALVGSIIGASIGVFDLMRAAGGKGMKQAIRKTINGVIGGAIGGALGGFLNDAFGTIPWMPTSEGAHQDLKMIFPKSTLATGLVILGACIGLLIGAAQVLLKEAWVRVEQGFKAGREMILTKPDTTVGRAEGSDIPLFGDAQCEKTHAHIVLKGDRYVLVDNGTPGGTYLNGQRINGQAPLKSGDLIGCGKSVLRFEERAKRN